MAGLLPGDPSHHGMYEGGPYKFSPEKLDEGAGRWYLLRKEIEENSPSKHDGIDLKKEAYLRKSYCTFLQDLGMRLKVPQVTIATAIIFCHRFFLRQSHAKNDRRTIATVCMFLAGKVEETPRPLKDVILVSYEIIHKKDPAAAQRIKQKEVYEQQKELILLGERVVLATLGFDLNVHHPYKPLVEAIKKFKVAQNALAQVAWNFVNDGLRTSLCLQFKPHHIAAGAIFLAAKFLKVKLPSDGDKVWWQEFDVTPRQLEEVSNQMLELYEQNRVPPSQGSEVEGSIGASGVMHRALPKPQIPNEEHATSKPGGTLKPTTSSRPVSDQSYATESHAGPALRNCSNDYGSVETDHKPDGESYDAETDIIGDAQNHHTSTRFEAEVGGEEKNDESKDFAVGMKRIDKDKVKAALEKRRKSRADVARKTDVMDDDDLIERELEDGIELAADKREKKSSYDNIEEEGEVSVFDDSGRNHNPRKRKAGGSPIPDGRDGRGHMPPVPQHQDRNRLARHGFLDKRNVQENHA